MCNYLIYNELIRKIAPDVCGRNELRPYIMAAHCISICKLLWTFSVRSMNCVPTLWLRIVSFKLRFVSCYGLFHCVRQAASLHVGVPFTREGMFRTVGTVCYNVEEVLSVGKRKSISQKNKMWKNASNIFPHSYYVNHALRGYYPLCRIMKFLFMEIL